jgi:ATP-dependent RNA helicase DDX54/DBP10
LQMDRFRRGFTSILVVTDVAARGIDIPVLENVVNYDFPHGARVFVHRVGRTARAGRKGWAWSFVTHGELPHLLDLQLFLGRPISSKLLAEADEAAFTESLILGTFDREAVDSEVESIIRLDSSNSSLPMLRDVMRKGQGMYERSMGKASQASYARAKDMVKEGKWGLTGGAGEAANVHPVFSMFGVASTAVRHDTDASDGRDGSSRIADVEAARTALMRAVDSFRPSETVFEIGSRGKAPGALLMKDRRKTLEKIAKKTPAPVVPSVLAPDASEQTWDSQERVAMEMADEEDLKVLHLEQAGVSTHSDSGFCQGCL